MNFVENLDNTIKEPTRPETTEMGNSNTALDDEFVQPISALTDQEIEIVKEGWDDIEVKEELGMAIMIRFLLS